MTDEPSASPTPDGRRVDASRGGVARKINRLPPGEHLVVLGAQALPDQMVLRIGALSAELQAGTVNVLDKIFSEPPKDARGKRANAAQGAFWLSLLETLGLDDDGLRNVTLAELAEKINGKQAVAVINEAGFWSRVRPI